jgi:hypothetical protein
MKNTRIIEWNICSISLHSILFHQSKQSLNAGGREGCTVHYGRLVIVTHRQRLTCRQCITIPPSYIILMESILSPFSSLARLLPRAHLSSSYSCMPTFSVPNFLISFCSLSTGDYITWNFRKKLIDNLSKNQFCAIQDTRNEYGPYMRKLYED